MVSATFKTSETHCKCKLDNVQYEIDVRPTRFEFKAFTNEKDEDKIALLELTLYEMQGLEHGELSAKKMIDALHPVLNELASMIVG